jgi:hypothetical protein
MKTSIALLVASSAGSVSILNMEDTLNSEIHFGNAVVSAHCKADETKSLVGITTADNQQLSTAQHEHDFPDTVKAHLTGVATSCNGLLGTKPCASSAADYPFRRFYCDWTGDNGHQETTGPVAAQVSIEDDTKATYITCPTPNAQANHHVLTLAVRHTSGSTTTNFNFAGEVRESICIQASCNW